MKILALDSSGLVASAAVVEDDNLIAEYTMNYKKTHSQTLLPMLEEIRQMTELDLSTIDAIATAAGPGSFTGLRIGAATVKGLGLALDKPIIAVPTVDALAYNMYGTDKIVCPIMDARREQVYTGIYFFERKQADDNKKMCTYELHILQKQCAVSIYDIARQLNELCAPLAKEIIFLGDGVPVFAERLSELMEVPYSFAPAHRNRQSAASVAVLAQDYYRQGKTQSATEHAPDYLRLSQAERELLEKSKQ